MAERRQTGSTIRGRITTVREILDDVMGGRGTDRTSCFAQAVLDAVSAKMENPASVVKVVLGGQRGFDAITHAWISVNGVHRDCSEGEYGTASDYSLHVELTLTRDLRLIQESRSPGTTRGEILLSLLDEVL